MTRKTALDEFIELHVAASNVKKEFLRSLRDCWIIRRIIRMMIILEINNDT